MDRMEARTKAHRCRQVADSIARSGYRDTDPLTDAFLHDYGPRLVERLREEADKLERAHNAGLP